MRLRSPTPRMIAFALCSLAVTYYVLWACAPTTTMPPPVPFAEDESGEFSASLAASALGYTSPVGAEAQLGYTWSRGPSADFGLQIYGGMNTLFGAGASVRHMFRPSERFAWGFMAQGGWLHASGGIPMSWKLGRNSWVWLHPRAGLDLNGIIGLSGGASLSMRGYHRLNLELGIRAIGQTDEIELGPLGYVPMFAFAGIGYSARQPD